MDKLEKGTLVLWLTLVMSAAIGCMGLGAAQAAPNFVVIVADDMNADDLQFMPNVQSLMVAQGLTFESAYVPNSTCCPSRATIYLGQYPHNHGIRRTGDAFRLFASMGHEPNTLATLLKNGGYRTALIGKYFNDYPADTPRYIPTGWNYWAALMDKAYYDYSINLNGKRKSYGSAPEDYQTDVLGGLALDVIDKQYPTQPMFLYVAPSAPHEPAVPADRHANAFFGYKAPRKPSTNERDVSDKPSWVQNLRRYTHGRQADIDTKYQKRLETLLGLDELVANVVNALSTKGMLDNTYVFFLSDNGYHHGEHRIVSGKGSAYEETIHMPLVVRGPGVPVGSRSQLVLTNDLLPTMLELAGQPIPYAVDGRSLTGLFLDVPDDAWRNQILIENTMRPINEISVDIDFFYALRTKRHLYVEYIETGEVEYYDLQSDPYQTNSQHDTVDPSVLTDLSVKLNALITCVAADCKVAEDAP